MLTCHRRLQLRSERNEVKSPPMTCRDKSGCQSRRKTGEAPGRNGRCDPRDDCQGTNQQASSDLCARWRCWQPSLGVAARPDAAAASGAFSTGTRAEHHSHGAPRPRSACRPLVRNRQQPKTTSVTTRGGCCASRCVYVLVSWGGGRLALAPADSSPAKASDSRAIKVA